MKRFISNSEVLWQYFTKFLKDINSTNSTIFKNSLFLKGTTEPVCRSKDTNLEVVLYTFPVKDYSWHNFRLCLYII